MNRRVARALVALLSGSLFGLGLAVGGMTQPGKVIGFLDFGGAWDPSLALLMAAGLAVHVLAYRFIRGSAAPFFSDEFLVPSLRHIDWKLVSGAALFGVGWGIGGYCPGPAIVSSGSGSREAIVFVAMLLLGMFLADKLVAIVDRKAARRAEAARESHYAVGGTLE